MPEENLLREVVGDYKNDKDSKKNLNEESDEQELLNDWHLVEEFILCKK